MRKVFFIVAVLLLVLITSSNMIFAVEGPGAVLDFSSEDDFNELYENMPIQPEESEIDWENNMMHMTAIGLDPRVYFRFIDDEIVCDDYTWMKIGLMNPSEATVFEMHYKTYGSDITGGNAVHFDISAKDTARKDYVINIPERNLATAPGLNPGSGGDITETTWTGDLEYIRLDCLFFDKPSGQVPEGTEFFVEYVALFKTKEDADAFKIEDYRQAAVKPSPTITENKTEEKTATPAKTTASPAKTTPKKTDGGSSNDKKDDNNIIIYAAIGAAVLVIAAAAVIVLRKKKK